MKKNKTLCFCGHSIERLTEKNERKILEQQIFSQVDAAVDEGYDTFLFSGRGDFELMAAKQVILRKKLQKGDKPNKLKLIFVQPYESGAFSIPEKIRREYFDIIFQCDGILYDRRKNADGADVSRFMADRSGKMICYYDGGADDAGYSVFYAYAKSLEIVNLCKKSSYIVGKMSPAS